jgi:hypothetical protein
MPSYPQAYPLDVVAHWGANTKYIANVKIWELSLSLTDHGIKKAGVAPPASMEIRKPLEPARTTANQRTQIESAAAHSQAGSLICREIAVDRGIEHYG